MVQKWGICSTGMICNDFCNALKTLSEAEHKIVAVVSRTKEKGVKFASKFDISTVYTSYEEFAKDPKIDIVYIGSISREHFRLTKLMLNCGKPVLCEVPLALTANGIKTLYELANEKNLFLMEAMWSRCNPVHKKIRECIANGEIGDVAMVRATLNIPFDLTQHPPRSAPESTMIGSLHELGACTIQFALLVYGEMPVSIKADGDVLKNGNKVLLTDKQTIMDFLCLGSSAADEE